jgi:hypothetical protein
MQVVFASLFGAACTAVGWLISRLWTNCDTMQDKFYGMLDKQFDDKERRKDLFDKLGTTIDGLALALRDLRESSTREIQALRTELQAARAEITRIRP